MMWDADALTPASLSARAMERRIDAHVSPPLAVAQAAQTASASSDESDSWMVYAGWIFFALAKASTLLISLEKSVQSAVRGRSPATVLHDTEPEIPGLAVEKREDQTGTLADFAFDVSQ